MDIKKTTKKDEYAFATKIGLSFYHIFYDEVKGSISFRGNLDDSGYFKRQSVTCVIES